jgi:hypothetical protein
VSAELEPHGREEFVLEIRVAARTESFVQFRGKHWYRNAFVDAVLMVPRSSPESETRPTNFENAGSLAEFHCVPQHDVAGCTASFSYSLALSSPHEPGAFSKISTNFR